jgi:hypothetical protein
MLALIKKYNIILLDPNEEVFNLSNLYIKEGIIPEKFLYDAFHIAYTSVHNLNCLLTFNCKHINKKRTKELVEIINKREGYGNISIYTPVEVLNDEE